MTASSAALHAPLMALARTLNTSSFRECVKKKVIMFI